MPCYEYECNECDIKLEVKKPYEERESHKCPNCGCKMVKLVSKTSFSLKGTGWAADGYASPAYKKPRC